MHVNYRYQNIIFFEHGLQVKSLATPMELKESYKLRHKVFAEELNWITAQKNYLDIDTYDGKNMAPIGVFDQGDKLIAQLRITLPQRVFMMEKEFAELIDTSIDKNPETVEVSRVCTTTEIRRAKIETDYGNFYISMLLYKGLYLWCLSNNISIMYMVIEYKLLRLLKLSGFPCHKAGPPTIMPDGVTAVAVKISWKEFQSINENKKPQLLGWFNDIGETRQAA